MSKAKETKTKIKIIAGLAGVISVLAVVIFPLAAFANADPANTTAKITYSQLNDCIKDNYFAPELTVDEFTSLDVLFPTKIGLHNDSRDDKDQVLLPTSYGHSVSRNSLSCYQLFTGAKGWTGIATNKFKSTKNKAEFLENFGYTKTTDGGGLNKCLYLTYRKEGDGTHTDEKTGKEVVTTHETAPVCVHVEEKNGKYVVSTANGSKDVKVDGTEGTLFSYPDNKEELYTYVDPEQLMYGHVYIGIGLQGTAPSAGYTTNDGPYKVFHFNDGDDWNTVVSNYEKFFKENIKQENFYTYNEYSDPVITHLGYEAQSASTSDDGVGRTTYKYTGANVNTIKKYLGVDSQFVDTYDLYSMYDHYLFDYYNLSIDNTTCRKRSEGAPTGNEIYVATSTSEINVCAITESSKLNASSKGNVQVLSNNGTIKIQEGGIDDIIKWNQNLSIMGGPIENAMANKELTKRGELGGDGTSGGDGTTGGSGSSSDDGSADDDGEMTNEEICFKGAGSLGWIMCPVVMATSELADTIYDKIEKEYLQVQATSIFDESNGVPGVWATFRNLANILFVLFLLFMIFSQLTGYGIDNYGIKKSLPRLIIAAIIVNFSFILCQLAVDISNIVGASLRGLLEVGLEVSGAPTSSGVGIGAASVIWIGGAAAFFFANPAAVSTIVILLLSVVVAIFFLWLILIARQAGIVICTVISPIMLIFYLLPNTEKISRKWLDIMKGLLLLYPICALVVGGGKLAGAILSNVEGDTWKVAAMIVQVVPYFIIPSLLRGSINAINGLGDKLGNMGSRGQQRAFGKMYNSETADRIRTDMNASNLFGRRNLADKISKTKAGKVLGRPFYKSITRANQKKKNYLADDQKASNTMQQTMFEAAEQKDQKKIIRDRAKGIDTTTAAYQGGLTSTPNAILEQLRAANSNNDEERFNSLVTEYQRRTSASKTAEMLAQFMDDEQGNGILGGAKRADFMRRLAETHASTLAKTPDLQQYLQTGGIDSTGNHIGFNDGATSYMQRNFNGYDDGLKIGDLKDNQVVGAGSGAIARMIQSGQLTQPQAQRIMANKSNREKMDDVQQLLLGAFANNGSQISKNDAEAALKDHTGVGGLSADQITAMLEDGGDDVVIRDVRWRNEEGEHQQTDPLVIKHDDLDTQYSRPDYLKQYDEMIKQRVASGDLTREEGEKYRKMAEERTRQNQNGGPQTS